MKRLLLTIQFLGVSILLIAQTQGISYQAVIINQNAQEVPGVNISGNVLQNEEILVRFTILDQVNSIDYQEIHTTTTDKYGMINLVIGHGIPTAFSPLQFIEIDWDGTPKSLKVDISLSTTNVFFFDLSFQDLTFIPYAFHKNITATGTLGVQGKSTLQDLSVEKTTNLEGNLSVNNQSKTLLTGSLTVDQSTTLQNTLTVNAKSSLRGQVTIDADVAGDQGNQDSYPLRVRGSNQGVAIQVTGSRNKANNFVTFWDDHRIHGAIEGESIDDINSDPKYIFDNVIYAGNTVMAAGKLIGALTSSTACIGLVPCVTTPTPSLIIAASANVVVRGAQLAAYNYFRRTNAGVVYKSKGADYAEYLPKLNPNDFFAPGDIVGVTGGKVTRSTSDAHMAMVVSQRPIVLGNMPEEGKEADYAKIAFLGQVETKVFGKVNIGDYIIPSGHNDGFGIAVSPNDILPEQFMKIVGVAWSGSTSDDVSYVNVAVGLSNNSVTQMLTKQDEKIRLQDVEITGLRSELKQMHSVLAQLLPNYANLMGLNQDDISNLGTTVDNCASSKTDSSVTYSETEDLTIFYFDFTPEYALAGIELAKSMFNDSGEKSSDNPLFQKLDNDENYKNEFVNEMVVQINKLVQKSLEIDQKYGANAVKLN